MSVMYTSSIWEALTLIIWKLHINIWRTRQNGGHSVDDIFKCIFLNEYVCISINFSLFPGVKLTIFHIGSDNGLTPTRRQAIILTNNI